MSQQHGMGAIAARQAALDDRHATIVDADRVLADAVADAHAALRDSVLRLDLIAADIERMRDLAIDTPLGAWEFQRYLLDKQREIAAVVTEARDLSRAKSAVLRGLREQYSARS